MEDKYISCMIMHAIGDTIGYKNGKWEFMAGDFEKANEKLGIKVELGDPFSRTQAPAFLQDVLKRSGLAFSTALGLALRKLQEIE